jgi:hypothetical protein
MGALPLALRLNEELKRSNKNAVNKQKRQHKKQQKRLEY